jgi:hypothetical protein
MDASARDGIAFGAMHCPRSPAAAQYRSTQIASLSRAFLRFASRVASSRPISAARAAVCSSLLFSEAIRSAALNAPSADGCAGDG